MSPVAGLPGSTGPSAGRVSTAPEREGENLVPCLQHVVVDVEGHPHGASITTNATCG